METFQKFTMDFPITRKKKLPMHKNSISVYELAILRDGIDNLKYRWTLMNTIFVIITLISEFFIVMGLSSMWK